MGHLDIGYEGKTLIYGDAKFDYDSAWSKYEEAFEREYRLTSAGYGVRRTELEDPMGKISGRGVRTIIYIIWTHRGKPGVAKPRGRKPRR